MNARFRLQALALLALVSFLPAGEAAETWISATVRKVDPTRGRVVLRHAEVPHLDMPAMTMSWRVQEPGFLSTLHEGDKVEFQAERISGTYTLTAVRVVEPAQPQ